MKSAVRVLLVATLTVIAAGTVRAQNMGWYGGLSIGQSRINIADDNLAVAGATSSTLSKEETDTGYKLFAGYRLNRNLALEGGFTDFGKFSATRDVSAPPPPGSVRADIKSSGVFFDVLGIVPLNGWNLFGRAGLIYTTTTTDLSTSGGVILTGSSSESASEVDPEIGFGAEFRISSAIGIRAEWQRAFKVGDPNTTGEGDVDLISVGVVAHF